MDTVLARLYTVISNLYIFCFFQDQQPKRTFGRNYVSELIRDTIFTEKKRTELIKIWPQMFYEMVYNAVTDMEDLQAYMKKCTEELEKGWTYRFENMLQIFRWLFISFISGRVCRVSSFMQNICTFHFKHLFWHDSLNMHSIYDLWYLLNMTIPVYCFWPIRYHWKNIFFL